MQTFKYTALSRDGTKVSGQVDAFDEYAAAAEIRQEYPTLVSLKPVSTEAKGLAALFRPKISEKALAVMCSQFAIILSSGLSVMRAVELIAGQTDDKNLKKILLDAAADVAAGFSLARSLENKGRGSLPVTLIETIRAGEESGTLDTSFARLQAFYDKSHKTKSKVKSAMAYPIFTLVAAIVVIIIIMVKAVPTFVKSFTEMNVTLPGPTRLLIGMSNFFVNYWFVLAIAAVVLVLAWKLWGRTAEGRLTQHRMKLRPPILGKLALMKSAAQFANTMTTMLAAGIPVVRALDITGRVLDNRFLGHIMTQQIPQMEAGHTLAECMANTGYMPELLVEMTHVGEQTGSLESTLQVIGAYYDNETENLSQKALSLLEPAIICLLAVVVCFVLLSVYLPMFSLYGST